jgi:hypothetical protein
VISAPTRHCQVKIIVSAFPTSGTFSERAYQETTTKDYTAASFCFLKYLASLRPEADRAVSILPWVLSRGSLCKFLWADLSFQKKLTKGDLTPAYLPVSDRRRLAALVALRFDQAFFMALCLNILLNGSEI